MTTFCSKLKIHIPFFMAFLLILFGRVTEIKAEKQVPPPSRIDQLEELPAEEVGARANELLKQINKKIADGERFNSAFESASQEDRLVIDLQLIRLQNSIFDLIQQSGEMLLALEKKGPQPILRRELEKRYSQIPSNLRTKIMSLKARLDKARAQRMEVELKKRFALENKISRISTRVDELFEMRTSHILNMGKIGMDNSQDLVALGKDLGLQAEELSGRIHLALVRIKEVEMRTAKKIPGDTEAPSLLIVLLKDLDTNARSMDNTLNQMDSLGIDTANFRTELAMATRDFSSSMVDVGLAMGLVRKTAAGITAWFFNKGPSFILKLFLFSGIIILFLFMKRIIRSAMKKFMEVKDLNISQLARQTIVSWVSNLVLMFGVLIALSQLGINLGPMLAGLGIAGFIIGFALQDTLSNFASGVMILIYQPYDVDDIIDVSGVYGTVNNMNLVSTTILTFDNQTIVVPNNKIWGGVIKNVTSQTIRRVDMVFGISYSDDIPKAEKIFSDILDENNKVLKDPEPMIHLHTLGASSVDFIVRPWVKVEDYWEVYWEVTRTVKLRFDKEGVSIPFPQQDVHIYHTGDQNPAKK